jgi:hypothetical protein
MLQSSPIYAYIPAAKDLSAFAPEALAAYEAAFARYSVIAAGCGGLPCWLDLGSCG